MLILNKCKLGSYLSFRFIITLLICVLILNVYLFYNLKSISYLQTTVLVLVSNFFLMSCLFVFFYFSDVKYSFLLQQNEYTRLKHEESKITDSVFLKNEINKRGCKSGNYSLFMSDTILQLKEDLEEFYWSSPNFTTLPQQCNKFLQDTKFNLNHGLILVIIHYYLIYQLH